MNTALSGRSSARDPLTLPRGAWAEHPRFASQALLLRSHESFRRRSRSLLQQALAGGAASPIYWLFRVWKGSMHSHEAYEETKLYPFLAERWGIDFTVARAGHDALGQAERAVLAASRHEAPADASLVEALRSHDEVLVEHLALEEELVLPALLALEPAEFEDYLRSEPRF